ncbi:hypothetical protein HaLaN_22112 [Haematococcus lacustris]|uniref:Uncharacterized protein n=1 Tax=Haematococcus lacustris TaxID=44745 RepID=A0A699ZND1_HAELA|nr:hypothetical protein HaLaN_22112 [Haematococcus lacustris]
METAPWPFRAVKARYDSIKARLAPFLKQTCGFKDAQQGLVG